MIQQGLSRRSVLAAGGALGAAGAMPLATRAATASVAGAPVVLHDPALPASLALARTTAPGARTMAITGDRVRFWQTELSAHRGPIAGVTRWSDLLLARGLAAEQGLRLRAETRHETANGALFAWLIA